MMGLLRAAMLESDLWTAQTADKQNVRPDRNPLIDRSLIVQTVNQVLWSHQSKHQMTTNQVEICPNCEICPTLTCSISLFNEGVMCSDYFLLYPSAQYLCACSCSVGWQIRTESSGFGFWSELFICIRNFICEHISVCFWFCGIFCVVCLLSLLPYVVRTLLKNTFLISLRFSWLHEN